MKTYTLKNFKGEKFTIGKIDEMEGLNNLKAKLIANGKEPVQYHLKRVIEGTRKKAYFVPCWRFVESGNFQSIM